MKLSWFCKSFAELNKEELYAILALRSEVFVVEQNCVFQDMDFKDQIAMHFMGINENGVLVAYTRLFGLNQDYENHISIGRVVTKKAYRKEGFGIDLMKKSIEMCYKLYGKHPIKIGAQQYLIKFYKILGFQEIGKNYIEDGIPHCLMVKEV